MMTLRRLDGASGRPARTSPRAPGGVLVMREDSCVMSGRPTHDAEASSSRAALPESTLRLSP
jgi:hypothetical protein